MFEFYKNDKKLEQYLQDDNILFHFTTFKNALSILSSNKLHSSKFTEFKDINEKYFSEPVIFSSGLSYLQINKIREKIEKLKSYLNVISFCSNGIILKDKNKIDINNENEILIKSNLNFKI
jgi:hypothetical protein